MIPEEETPQESPLRVWGTRLLKAAIAVLAGYFTYRFFTHSDFDWSRLAERVAAARAPFVALGTGLLLARYAIWDWRYQLAVRYVLGRRLGPVLGFFVLLASAALNLITPTARVLGGMMRARYFARAQGRPFSLLYGVVLYDQVAHHGVMSVCTWITLIATAFVLHRAGWGFLLLGALAVSLLALAVWSRRAARGGESPAVGFLARRAERAEGRLQKLFAHGHEAVGIFVRLLGVNVLRFQAVALGVFYFLVNAAGLWAMFLAIGAPVGPFAALAAATAGTAVGTLSGTPGGVGTTELAMMASFRLLGVDEVSAAAGTLLYRGLHYAGVLAVGLPALALLEWRQGVERDVLIAPEIENG
ncbi:MAG TPA: lysylphosphatidylglycerol synthase transmembrane domain-containing protein [Thermoanaerobaculia bacterium]